MGAEQEGEEEYDRKTANEQRVGFFRVLHLRENTIIPFKKLKKKNWNLFRIKPKKNIHKATFLTSPFSLLFFLFNKAWECLNYATIIHRHVWVLYRYAQLQL